MHNPHSYDEYKTNIQTGDIFCTMADAQFSKLIRTSTGSRISHCGIFLWIWPRLFVVEMLEWRDCRLMLASQRFSDEPFYHWKPAYLDKTAKQIEDDALRDVGTIEYSIWLAVLSFFIVTKSSRSFCSASVAKWLGMEFNLQTRGIMPNDIVNRCKQPLILVTNK